MADLTAAVGATSIRLKYPEYHFAKWGQTIEVEDAKHFAALGMKDHAAFVIGMTAEHSTAPSGTADWERDYCIPKNLYEAIFDQTGTINPDNYYATCLAATFATYKDWVKYWEIFNEPDWVADWKVTQQWAIVHPGASGELVRFHGTIFSGVASSPAYARNYLQKSLIWAKASGLIGVDWFTLSDGADASDPFDQMGPYADVGALTALSDAAITTSGQAYRTTSRELAGTQVDAAATARIQLAANAKAFTFATGSAHIVALWAVSESGEVATAQASIPCDASCVLVDWDGQNHPVQNVVGGVVTVDLTNSPVLLRTRGL